MSVKKQSVRMSAVVGLQALALLVVVGVLSLTFAGDLRADVKVIDVEDPIVVPEPSCWRRELDGVCGNPCPGGTISCSDGTSGPACQDSPTPRVYKCVSASSGSKNCNSSGQTVTYWRQYYICAFNGEETTYTPHGQMITISCSSATLSGGACGNTMFP